ncbi:MAG TPA: hypothetical protein HA362_04765 [Nanoarchaeota archaeon]|nr:hypothetical protein [Nanoarchaeota archaeon]
MEYTTPTEQQSQAAIYALGEAERILSNPSPSYQELFLHHTVLTADTNGLQLLRMQPRYRARLEAALEAIKNILPEDIDDMYLAKGDWARCVSGLKQKNLEIITSRELASERVSKGPQHAICRHGTWVAEAIICMLDLDFLIVPKELNPALNNPEEAVESVKKHEPFYILSTVVKELLCDKRVLHLKRTELPERISVGDFGKTPITGHIGWGKDYGDFLGENNVAAIPLVLPSYHYISLQQDRREMAFCMGLRVSDLGAYSAIYAQNFNFAQGSAFGVREQPQNKPERRGGFFAELKPHLEKCLNNPGGY